MVLITQTLCHAYAQDKPMQDISLPCMFCHIHYICLAYLKYSDILMSLNYFIYMSYQNPEYMHVLPKPSNISYDITDTCIYVSCKTFQTYHTISPTHVFTCHAKPFRHIIRYHQHHNAASMHIHLEAYTCSFRYTM